MSSMHVSLSEEMRLWVDAQVSGGRYHNASEYVRDLIRRDQDARDRLAAVRAHIDRGAADIDAGALTTLKSKRDVAAAMARLNVRQG